jgi:hypothetical protein
MDLGWSECSAAIAKKLAKREEYIVVGVQVARVLRKMLKARPGKRPCDVLIVSSSCEVTKPHERLQKANETVLSGIYRQLERLRVRVIYL